MTAFLPQNSEVKNYQKLIRNLETHIANITAGRSLESNTPNESIAKIENRDKGMKGAPRLL